LNTKQGESAPGHAVVYSMFVVRGWSLRIRHVCHLINVMLGKKKTKLVFLYSFYSVL